MNKLFINTILLGGSTSEKLHAARSAGFDQVELWQQDVKAYPAIPEALRSELDARELSLTDYQVLLDFDGAPDEIRDAKRSEALDLLDTALKLGATTVLVPASTRSDCVLEHVDKDMAWLADEALHRGLRVAYEGMAWSTFNHTLVSAWDLVKRIDRENVGVVVDAFHIFARGRDASDLDGIPADRIFLVQFSDLEEAPDLGHVVDVARHRRLLPGKGHFPLSTIVDKLVAKAYQGPVGLEVFNDDLKAQEPTSVAELAMSSLRRIWPSS